MGYGAVLQWLESQTRCRWLFDGLHWSCAHGLELTTEFVGLALSRAGKAPLEGV